MRAILAALLLLGLTACDSEEQKQTQQAPAPKPDPVDIPSQTPPAGVTLTPEQQAAYDQCLHDSMAMAMAWAMIEKQCVEQVTATAPLAPPQPAQQ